MYARYDKDNPLKKQLLIDHIDGVRRRVMERFPNDAIIELAALLHDVGKMSPKDTGRQNYLFNGGERIPHSPAGLALLEKISATVKVDDEETKLQLTETIKYLIGAHHGLFDFMSPNGEDKLSPKIKNAMNQRSDESIEIFLQYYPMDLVEEKFKQAYQQFIDLKSNEAYTSNASFSEFRDAFVIRMYLSALIDSDWSDAQAFTDEKFAEYETSNTTINWKDLLLRLKKYVENFEQKTTVNEVRTQIGEECEKAAS